MTDADKAMNPQHFYSDPADMRIRINQDSNPRSLLVDISAWSKFALSECSCCCCCLCYYFWSCLSELVSSICTVGHSNTSWERQTSFGGG